MYSYVSPCNHVLPCIAMFYHVLPCITMYCYVLPRAAIYCHALPCFAMYCHVLPCIAMYCHVLLCIAMYCHVLPCNNNKYSKIKECRTESATLRLFVDNRDVDDFGTILNKLKQYHLLKGGFSVKFLYCVKYIV